MQDLTRFPSFVFVLSLLVLWLAARTGALFFRNLRQLEESDREDFKLIQGATLTLLALLLGFSFSMAITRYDQRKNYEEAEANAIGTEYLRADLLPVDEAAKVRELLKDYLDERILFYRTRDAGELRAINERTANLQTALWAAVLAPPAIDATRLTALAVAGMNDAINSQGYTQAAWRNRIPLEEWALLLTIAVCANVLVGYGARRAEASAYIFALLPVIISIALFMIADIDSPRGGLIHVRPQNLESLAQSLQGH
jgi:hypothetical protein